MNEATWMTEAANLTREGRLAEATALIQRHIGGGRQNPLAGAMNGGWSTSASQRAGFRGGPRMFGRGDATRVAQGARLPDMGYETVSQLRSKPNNLPGTTLVRAYRGTAGQRPYLLYVPSSGTNEPRPLIVMLHGGTQTAADFAAATRMCDLAEKHGFVVVFPEQVPSANPMRFWNWFQPAHQRRGTGEPAIIAGIVKQLRAEYSVDPARIYVAGFSAGAAMAANMAATHPELFAAVGVHSGLPYGCARDAPSALAAMGRGGAGRPLAEPMPIIAFAGDHDATVNPANAGHVVEQFVARGGSVERTTTTSDAAAGRRFSHTVLTRKGEVVGEQWIVQGCGHAWSGGASGLAYTDPHGPDASAEMLRFFAEHPRR